MSITYLKEEEINIESIANLFKSAFLRTTVNPENESIEVEFDSLKVKILLEQERKRLLFSIFLPLRDKTFGEALMGANHQNNTKVLARFTAEHDEDLVFWFVDYTMSYEMGVIPFQVVTMAKLFERVAIGGVREFLGIE